MQKASRDAARLAFELLVRLRSAAQVRVTKSRPAQPGDSRVC